MYEKLLGIDLGTRSVHVSDGEKPISFISEKLNDRSKEISFLFDCFTDVFGLSWRGYIEEPVVAGVRNLRVSLQIAQVAGALMSTGSGRLVPVTQWKKEVVGKGNANKMYVAKWFKDNHPKLHAKIEGQQDLVDASCIHLYAVKIDSTKDRIYV